MKGSPESVLEINSRGFWRTFFLTVDAPQGLTMIEWHSASLCRPQKAFLNFCFLLCLFLDGKSNALGIQ